MRLDADGASRMGVGADDDERVFLQPLSTRMRVKPLMSRKPGRREFLTATVGMLRCGWLGRLAAAVPEGPRRKSCILLWMAGGPSHIDTFDPKPDAAENIRGEFWPIDTSVSGVRISEHFPRFAR